MLRRGDKNTQKNYTKEIFELEELHRAFQSFINYFETSPITIWEVDNGHSFYLREKLHHGST